ncbi:hypothetical protein OROMI_031915 [Orobanche minor]
MPDLLRLDSTYRRRHHHHHHHHHHNQHDHHHHHHRHHHHHHRPQLGHQFGKACLLNSIDVKKSSLFGIQSGKIVQSNLYQIKLIIKFYVFAWSTSSKRRPFSASMNSGNCFEPLAEDLAWDHADPNFILSNLSKNNSTPDYASGGNWTNTNTRPLVISLPLDQITDAIRMYFKNHFYTPGCAKVESLNQLALGMNKKRAAGLFYQTCLMKSCNDITRRKVSSNLLKARNLKW